jgi:hypothetical protein
MDRYVLLKNGRLLQEDMSEKEALSFAGVYAQSEIKSHSSHRISRIDNQRSIELNNINTGERIVFQVYPQDLYHGKWMYNTKTKQIQYSGPN